MMSSLSMFPRLMLIFALMAAPARGAAAFDALLLRDNLWSLDQEGFQMATQGLPFAWTSNARDSARAARPGMTLFALPVYEVIARFSGGKLNEITASFYARGDAGDLTQDGFDAVRKNAAEAVSAFTKVKPTLRGKDPTNAVRAEGIVWRTANAQYVLESSFTRKIRDVPFRAEFVRLEVTPPPKNLGLLAGAASTARNRFVGAQHVQRDVVSGDVRLPDVPMVDQGQKGYCVVATTERVMRYYGTAVDANELAQIANTSTDGGTSSEGMREALRKLAARLRVRVRSVEDFTVSDLTRLISDYNRAAKRSGAPEIPDQGRLIDVGGMYRAMRTDVLKEVRTKNKADLGRFQRTVQARIDEGVPLLWCVQLGLIPEPGLAQAVGGHMRLIIGYNSKNQEILYSDSWGAGHELKRMPAADAWTITTQLMTIEPFP